MKRGIPREIIQWYIRDELSASRIAKKLFSEMNVKTTHKTVLSILRRYGVSTRSRDE